MGYFWDQLDQKWIPRPRWQRTEDEKRRASRRRRLLDELTAEIQDNAIQPPSQFIGQDEEYFAFTLSNDRAAKLYAALLARTLIGTDEALMKESGEQIAELTAGGELVGRPRTEGQ